MHFVIARYKKDISWADNLEKTVIQKDVDMPNIGREPASYLYFIIKNYCNLEGEYVFCQDEPFDHCPNFLEKVETENYFGVDHTCDLTGRPHHPGLPIEEVAKELGIERLLPIHITFKAGCQFKLTAEQIKQIPYEKYIKMLEVVIKNELNPYVFERLVRYIFKI